MLSKEDKSWYCPGCGEPGYDDYCDACKAFLDQFAGNCYECGRPMPEYGRCDKCKALEMDVKPEGK
jgi:predicted amidophosphoribosyltransferase